MVRITYKVHDIVIPEPNDNTKTISKDVFLAQNTHSEGGMIGFEAPDVTLVTNVLTPVDSLVVVRGESGSPDTIDHITFGSVPDIADKDLLWLIKGAEEITINHNTGSLPADSGPILLLSQAPKKMIGTRMVLLQRQGINFQEIAFDGIVGDGGVIVEDDNGNAVLVAGSVASAVNHIQITNAATGNDVDVKAIGTDTDIGITITPKGTGEVIGAMETMMIPLGDELTPNTVGVKFTIDIPNNINIVSVYQSTTLVPTGSQLTLDILDETVSIFSTKPTISVSQNNGEDGVLNSTPTVLTKGDQLEFSVDTVDSMGTSAGTKLFVRFYRTA